MKTAAFEINDAGLVAVYDGQLEPVSPAYARLASDGILVGENARSLARLEPRNIDNRFWHDLDERPLPLPVANGRSRADLAHAQLSQMWSQLRRRASGDIGAVACAVPATFKPAQLALILGLAQASEMPLNGFIDTAVAAATAWGGEGRFVFIDIHLHQALGTAVEVGARARRERVEVARRAGLVALQDAWMRMIAKSFVTRTRFDPLHQAATEQALLDALPGCLRALQGQSQVEIEIPFKTGAAPGGTQQASDRHSIVVTREEFLLEAQPFYDHILMSAHRLRRAGHPLTVALSAGAAALPGLAERFAEFRDCEVVRCQPGCSALAAAIHAEGWSSSQDSATLFRSADPLPRERAAPLAPVKIQQAQAVASKRAATHVLYKGKAHALSAEPLIAGLDGGESRLQVSGAAAGISPLHCSLLRQGDEAEVIDFSRYGTWLNDERVAGRARLHAGDRIRIGSPGVTMELIAIDTQLHA